MSSSWGGGAGRSEWRWDGGAAEGAVAATGVTSAGAGGAGGGGCGGVRRGAEGADLQQQSAVSPQPAQPALRAWSGLELGLASYGVANAHHLSYLWPPPLHCPALCPGRQLPLQQQQLLLLLLLSAPRASVGER